MARKAAPTKTADEIPSAMDYAQHEATWKGFVAMMKWVAIALMIVAVSLYCFIEGGQPVLGTLLLLILPVGAVWLIVTRSSRATA